jgi:hypothetical protein
MENQGVELALNYNPIHTDKFDWNVAFNATYNVNKITKLTNNNDPSYQGVLVGGIAGGVGSTIQIHSVGYPAYSFMYYNKLMMQMVSLSKEFMLIETVMELSTLMTNIVTNPSAKSILRFQLTNDL